MHKRLRLLGELPGLLAGTLILPGRVMEQSVGVPNSVRHRICKLEKLKLGACFCESPARGAAALSTGFYGPVAVITNPTHKYVA
jgi:hypothetical protein